MKAAGKSKRGRSECEARRITLKARVMREVGREIRQQAETRTRASRFEQDGLPAINGNQRRKQDSQEKREEWSRNQWEQLVWLLLFVCLCCCLLFVLLVVVVVCVLCCLCCLCFLFFCFFVQDFFVSVQQNIQSTLQYNQSFVV